MKIRTRFAPSPTGYLHIGSARTALFNWLYAKKNKGEYILRIEDTDKERSKDEFTIDILESLKWLNINSDIKPIYQSSRENRYKETIQKLLEEDKAYYCYCSRERLDSLRQEQMKNKQKPRYDGFCRKRGKANSNNVNPVIRFKNPLEGTVKLNDEVRGKVCVQNSELDDLILARSDGSPTYHLSVVVDDIDLEITHVIRGDDHLNNTPRQINIFRALQKPIPVYAHIPLIHGKDGKRLSKRHGAVSVNQYRKEGYLANALLNYLVRLGWSHGDQEIFSINELMELFDLNNVHQSAATFDSDKLNWVNQQHMKNSNREEIKPILIEYAEYINFKLANEPDISLVFDLQKERCTNLYEILHKSEYFYNEIKSYDENGVTKNFTGEGLNVLNILKTNLEGLKNWGAEDIKVCIKNVAESLDLKFGKVAPVLRLAVTGKSESPSIDITLQLLGQEKTLNRIKQTIEYIESRV